MEAFYYGRAFVQTLGDRMGAALGDFLAEAGKHDAERQQALRCVIPRPHPLVDLPPNAAWGRRSSSSSRGMDDNSEGQQVLTCAAPSDLFSLASAWG